MKKIWIIRHGESAANAGQATGDVAVIPLTEKGIAQAKAAAGMIDARPDLIVTSSYLRTQQTSEPTIARFPDVPVEVWPVHEFTYLAPRGITTAAERRPLADAFWEKADPAHCDGNGAESFADLIGRIRAMQKKINDLPDDSFTVIFCHGQVMQTLRFLLTEPGLTPAEIMKTFRKTEIEKPFTNCAIMKLTVEKEVFTLEKEITHDRQDRPKTPGL